MLSNWPLFMDAAGDMGDVVTARFFFYSFKVIGYGRSDSSEVCVVRAASSASIERVFSSSRQVVRYLFRHCQISCRSDCAACVARECFIISIVLPASTLFPHFAIFGRLPRARFVAEYRSILVVGCVRLSADLHWCGSG